MTVTILTQAADDVAPFSDEVVIDRLKQGTFQMAVVPARAWSAAGVTSLKALQAPFLFESDEHVAAVVDDAAITKDLFSGLEGTEVTGLTLFPESLRHLFSFGEPMLAPADVQGRTIRAISSLETTTLIEALGGTAVDPADDEYQAGVDAGTIHGTDSGFTLATISTTNRRATATGNVALYAKVMTLVINSAFWTGLDDAQRAIITTASDATRAWAIANQVTDADGRRRVLRRRRHRRPGRRRLDRCLPRRRGPGLRRPRGRPGDEARDRRRSGPGRPAHRRRPSRPASRSSMPPTWSPTAATCRTASTASSTQTPISRVGV